MSKNKKKSADVVEIGDAVTVPADVTISVDKEVKTDKKLLKAAEKLVRKLDRVVSELNVLQYEARSLRDWDSAEYSECTDKDQARLTELYNVIYASTGILFHVTERMSRKYTGKDIEPLGQDRKSLKKAS